VDYRLLLVINFIASVSIFWMCICRLSASSRDVHPVVRGYYSIMLPGSLANGFQTILFGEYPTTGGTVLAICVMAGLVAGAARWRHGAPDETKSRPWKGCKPECNL
jgi:hypothetical protein